VKLILILRILSNSFDIKKIVYYDLYPEGHILTLKFFDKDKNVIPVKKVVDNVGTVRYSDIHEQRNPKTKKKCSKRVHK